MRSIPNTVLRGKSDEQLAQELATAEHILMVESFGFDHEARDRVRSEVFQLYDELKRRGALHSQKKAKQQQNTLAKKQGIPRPRCEYKASHLTQLPTCWAGNWTVAERGNCPARRTRANSADLHTG
jgi:hypothetical protein